MKEQVTGYLGKATAIGREVLASITPPDAITTLTSTAADEAWQGSPGVSLAQILVVANKDNAGEVQVALYETPDVDNYVPLDAKDSVNFGGINSDDLHLRFEVAGDKVHLMQVRAVGDISNADTV